MIFLLYGCLYTQRLPAPNETEPPQTIIKNNNNLTQECNNGGQNHTSMKMFPPSRCAARDCLWSDSGPTVSMVGRGLLSPGSRVPGLLLGLLLDGFSPLRANFLPCSTLTSILGSSQCGRGRLLGLAWL